jgi:hypothetical protein
VRGAGGDTSAYADMSSERRVRIPSAESPRFPGRGQSSQGESVPKARPKGVVDGNQVNIPEPALWSDAGVEKDSQSGARVSRLRW